MALWGTNDSVLSEGTVSLDYETGIVIGSGTSFGTVGSAKTGDVIRFGVRGDGGVYYGDAVIVSIASSEEIAIGSTAGLSGDDILDEEYYISELPLYTTGDSTYSENVLVGTEDKLVYGISTTSVGAAYTTTGIGTQYHVPHAGWVGIHTYIDAHGYLRVKSEVLVASSGIQTGSYSINYVTNV
jgi:hypothetical protein